MKIDKNKVIGLTYELEVDGKIVDKATNERPLDYIHGTHMLIPRFEDELEGKEPGNEFEFTLTPSEGYGEYDMSKKFDLPLDSFMVDGKVMNEYLVVGQTIPMMNGSGQVVQGTIAEVKDDAVTMDFNHPMAGKTLHFKGEVLTIREATEKELEEGLHGEYLPQEEEDCCCHGEGHKRGDGECCHGKGHHGDGECCHHDHDEEEGPKECKCCQDNG